MIDSISKNKIMPEQKPSSPLYVLMRGSRKKLALPVAALAIFALLLAPIVKADTFDQQINALRDKNNQNQQALSALSVQASSYQDAISRLQSQIAVMQQSIIDNQARQAQLQQQIIEKQQEIDYQRKVLGEDIKAMYVDGQMSQIEMLATSSNLSAYVDKEQDRVTVQKKIQDTLAQIAALQKQLQAAKLSVDNLIKDEKSQESQLSADKAQQASLLAYNQSQQADYNNQMKANNAQIAKLEAEQAAANCAQFGCSGGTVGGGGYPWGRAVCIHTGQVTGPCYNYDWAVNGSVYNPSTGGYGYRNCTDWVAWRIRTHGGYVPSGLGNARQWPDRAPGHVVSEPSAGNAAVSQARTYGHVMYVEAVNSDGSLLVSDYNRAGTGLYDMSTLPKVGDNQYRTPGGTTYSLVFMDFN